MKLCVVIPVYNHGDAIGGVVASVLRHRLPCLMVDDGSEPGCAQRIRELVAAHPDNVSALRLDVNQGKGAAMLAGFREAGRLGYSHALQIDADGQHDGDDLPRFAALAEQHPQAVICGTPVYDTSVPQGRLLGRDLPHVFPLRV